MDRNPKRSAHIKRGRTSAREKRLYEIIDNNLPVKPSVSLIVAAMAVMFILFATACFSAVIFGSSSEKLTEAREHAGMTDAHYAAETTAADILASLAADNGASLTDENGELKYGSDAGEIPISHNGGVYSLSVPIAAASDAGKDAASDSPQEGMTSGGSTQEGMTSGSSTSAGAKESLHVVARITEGTITLIEWYVEDL